MAMLDQVIQSVDRGMDMDDHGWPPMPVAMPWVSMLYHVCSWNGLGRPWVATDAHGLPRTAMAFPYG